MGGISPPSPDAVVLDAAWGDDAAAPEQVLELAASCVRFCQAKYKVPPDFTPETLPIVDQYVRDSRAAVEERPESLALTAQAIGAYLGEVVRMQYPSWWRLDMEDSSAWRLEFRDSFLCFYPVQVAYTALTLDKDEAVFPGFELPTKQREAMKARLAELPPVSEDEFYAPSTRLEVLDIVIDGLQTDGLASQKRRRKLGPRDYE